MTPLRRRLRRLRRITVYGLALLIILAGLLVAVASRLLPLVRQHPEEVARWLSDRSGKAVSFDVGDAEWTRRGPLFTLDHLRIGEGDSAIEVGRARLLVSVYSGLLPGRPLTELHLEGLELHLLQDTDGRWSLGGFGSGGGGDSIRSLQGLGEIRLNDARLDIESASSGRHYQFERIDARLLALGGTVRFGVSAYRGESSPLRIAGELNAELTDGQLYAGGGDLELASWLGGQTAIGMALNGGRGRIEAWAQLDDRRVVSMQLGVDLKQLSAQASSKSSDPVMLADDATLLHEIDSVSLTARWQLLQDGWLLEVPDLQIVSDGNLAHSTGIRLARQNGWRVQAQQLTTWPLPALAALSTALPAGLRGWLQKAQPNAIVDDLRVVCTTQDACSGELDIQSLSMKRVRRIPGVNGLAGHLSFGPEGGNLQLAPGQFDFDARGIFRGAQRLSARGNLAYWRSTDGWRIGSDELTVSAHDFALRSKGWLEWQDDGSKPRADLYAETAPSPVSAAGQFWVPRKMSKKVIGWLDTALVSGHTGYGRLLIQGDFDHWPFREDSDGRLEALAELQDITLNYQPGAWPPAHHLNGVARFVNQGMQLEGSAEINDITVKQASGRLDDFRNARLLLDIQGEGRGEKLLGLLRQSPLEARYGDQLQGLSVGGRGRVQVNLDLPFKEELGDKKVNGHVDLESADLADSQWNLRFAGATGRLQFNDEGFLAQELRVRYLDQPASLSIAVGRFTSSEERAVEATLRGRFDVDSLLDQNVGTHWLKPYLQGDSDVALLLNVPAVDGSTGAPAMRNKATRLRVRSDLRGVQILLPAPLRKVADARLPLDLMMELPVTGLDLHLGRLVHLRGRLPDGGGLDGVAVFGGGDAPVDAGSLPGLRVEGSAPVLDAAGWAAFATADGDGTVLRGIDLRSGQLDLLGRSFMDVAVNVAVDEDNSDTRINFDGEALAGDVLIPGSELGSRGIDARLQRLYWPSADLSQGNAVLASIRPADIPPLHISVDDLHFGNAQLGKVRLETYPTPEGLHVEQFEAVSAALQLHASGDWQLLDGSERSGFHFTFTSEDAANMLEALGFASIVQGGQTLVDLDAHWAGSPAAFALARMQGRLRMTVGEGSIPDIKPGAGRLLGLVSLTEIPRRLSLDFSDFFRQGFSFNSINGEFELRDGNAYTDDLHIDSPAADIHISGRTGLAQRDYDQQMEVLPRTSSVLPVVGALAAGPAGAAIGAVAQAILQRPMKQIGRTLYQINGSWEEPLIDTLERGPARDVDGRRRRTDKVESGTEGDAGSPLPDNRQPRR